MKKNKEQKSDAGYFVPCICHECVKEKRTPRDADAICHHCGMFYCGGHIMEHLKKDHCVGDQLYAKKKEQ